MSRIKRGRVGARIKRAQASPNWGRARGVLLFLGAGLGIGLFALLTHFPIMLGSWREPFKWCGAAWLFGLFVLVTVMTDDEPRFARSGFLIRTVSGSLATLGIALMFGLQADGIALALPIGALLGATGKYWLQGL